MTRQILIFNIFVLFATSFSLAMDEKLVAIHRQLRFSYYSRNNFQSAPDPFRQHSVKPQTNTKNFIQEAPQKEFQQTTPTYNPYLTFAEIERNLEARLQQARATEVPYYDKIAQLYASHTIEDNIALVKLISTCKSSAPEFEFIKIKGEDKISFAKLEKYGISEFTDELRTTINFNFNIMPNGSLYAIKPLQKLMPLTHYQNLVLYDGNLYIFIRKLQKFLPYNYKNLKRYKKNYNNENTQFS